MGPGFPGKTRSGSSRYCITLLVQRPWYPSLGIILVQRGSPDLMEARLINHRSPRKYKIYWWGVGQERKEKKKRRRNINNNNSSSNNNKEEDHINYGRYQDEISVDFFEMPRLGNLPLPNERSNGCLSFPSYGTCIRNKCFFFPRHAAFSRSIACRYRINMSP